MKKLLFGFVIAASVFSLASCGKGKPGAQGVQGEQGQKGDKGDTGSAGRGIEKISFVSKNENVDKYQITYTDGTSSEFNITNGVDGEVAQFQIANNAIQYKYSSDQSWIDLIELSSITQSGYKEVEFHATESAIEWKYKDSNVWIELVSFEVLKGQNGNDGRDVEFAVADGFIKWHYKDEATWTNLVELSSIAGSSSDAREVIISADANNIIWKYDGETQWKNLVSLEILKGSTGKSVYDVAVEAGYTGTVDEWLQSLKGSTGASGKNIELQVNSTHIQWRYENEEWADLIALSSLKGSNGESAYEIYKKHNTSYTKTEAEWIDDLVNGRLGGSNQHTVKFINDGLEYLSTTAVDGKPVTCPTEPTKAGYLFLGWFDGNDDKWVFNGYACYSDLTLTAKWKNTDSLVVLNANGGVVSETELDATYGENLTLPTPVREGYEFLGWYDGSKPVTSGTWSYLENIGLKAEWNIKTYKLSLDIGEGSCEITEKYVQYNSEYILPVPAANDSYNAPFAGWFTIDGEKIAGVDGVSYLPYDESKGLDIHAEYYIPITTKTEFSNMKNNLSGHYKLEDNIDYASAAITPIGESGTSSFTGMFDGDGYSVSNFSLAYTQAVGAYYDGLFGYANGASIKNLYIRNVTISRTKSAGSYYNYTCYTGALAGYVVNTVVSNVHVSSVSISLNNPGGITYEAGGIVGSMTNGSITDCSSYGKMIEQSSHCNASGGIVATGSNGVITRCISRMRVEAADGKAGGIIAIGSTMSISQCINLSSVTATKYAAGIAYDGSVSDCYNEGYVYGTYKAGISYSANVSNSYDIKSQGLNYSGDGTIQNSFTTDQITGNTTADMFIDAGWSTDIWDFSDDSNGYILPKLKGLKELELYIKTI